jgi:TP901 family phage tail tape measure protein
VSLETIFKLSVILAMVDRLSGPARLAGKEVKQLEGNMQAFIDKSNQMMSAGAKMVATGIATGIAAAMPVKATFASQKAIGELASVGIRDFSALETAATNFSNAYSGTVKSQFLSAAYDIKSGISSLSDAGVAEYTRLAALTAKATKSTTAEMTSLFATGYGIYKDMYGQLSDFAFGEMFSGGIAASVQQFKTTGSQMSQAISSLGASATSANRPLEEQLAILGMLQATMTGGESGTRYAAFISSAAKAGDALGLSFVDANNQLLGMEEILLKLRGKYGDTLDAIQKQELEKAFGTKEAVRVIELLYPKIDLLRDSVLSVQTAMKGGTGITEEMAQLMNIDPGSRWEIVGQQMQNLKETVGNLLTDDFNLLTTAVSGFILRIMQLAEENPRAAKTIFYVGASISALLVGIGGVITGLGAMGWIIGNTSTSLFYLSKGASFAKDAFMTLQIRSLYAMDALRSGAGTARTMAVNLGRMSAAAIRTAVAALPGLIASVWGFTAALLANPITWIVLGIIALIAVLYLLWRNWDKVTASIGNGWDRLKLMFILGLEFFRHSFRLFDNFLMGKIADFRQSGSDLIQAFVDGVTSLINKPYEVVEKGLVKLRRLLPFSDAKEGPLSTLTRSGRAMIETFANGISQRSGLLKQVTAAALAGAALSMLLTLNTSDVDAQNAFDSYKAPSVGFSRSQKSISLREIFREKTEISQREIRRESKQGPLVELHYHGGSRREADQFTRDLESFLERYKA